VIDRENRNPNQEHDSTGWLILGAILIIAGFFLGARSLGWVPWPLDQIWTWGSKARMGIGVIVLGILVIIWAQSGERPRAPRAGTKLYRTRQDKWLAGVLGGLARYFGLDVTMMRLLFLALVVLFDFGGLILAYIVMAIVVPLEPVGMSPTSEQPVDAAAASAPSEPPSWPAQPASPTPPAWPDQPVSPAPPAPPAPTPGQTEVEAGGPAPDGPAASR